MKNKVFVIDLGKSEIMGKSKSAEIPTEAEIDSFLVGSVSDVWRGDWPCFGRTTNCFGKFVSIVYFVLWDEYNAITLRMSQNMSTVYFSLIYLSADMLCFSAQLTER